MHTSGLAFCVSVLFLLFFLLSFRESPSDMSLSQLVCPQGVSTCPGVGVRDEAMNGEEGGSE